MKRHEIIRTTYSAKMCKSSARSQTVNETNQFLWLRLTAEQKRNGTLKGKNEAVE